MLGCVPFELGVKKHSFSWTGRTQKDATVVRRVEPAESGEESLSGQCKTTINKTMTKGGTRPKEKAIESMKGTAGAMTACQTGRGPSCEGKETPALDEDCREPASRPVQTAPRRPVLRRLGLGPASVALVLWLAHLSAQSIHAQDLVPGAFNTGVDNSGSVLANYSVDSHYKLIQSADPNFPGPDAVVVDDTLYPIANHAWLTNSSLSKWIAPQGNQDYLANATNGDAIGFYTYRTAFDLTGYDPNRVSLAGQWTCESQGTAVKINGLSTSNATPTNIFTVHTSWHPLLITNGFVPGINTLDFVVNRVPYGASILPTGIQVEFVVRILPPALQISLAGDDVLVWWPTNQASGCLLETSTSLGPNQQWSVFPGPVSIVGDQHMATVDATTGSKFFRLRQP